MASRKGDIKKMSSLIGNAAAHRAIYGANAFTIMEAQLYEGQAEEVAELRTYNEQEIADLVARSRREARNIIKKRRQGDPTKILETFYATADAEIQDFVVKVLRQRRIK